MAYSTSNPPLLKTPSFTNASGESATWTYSSTDNAAAVDADGYITNGKTLGMKAGDLVEVTDNDASPVIVTTHRVVSVSTSDNSVDLSDGDTAVTGTDSD